MAYRPATISPSSLGYNKHCPGFRSSGESNAASDDGEIYHDHMEKICLMEREAWDKYINETEMSNDMRWLVRESARELGTFLTESLPRIQGFRMVRRRNTKVFLKTKRLDPGVYTECELDLGGGRHGRIDCMIVPSNDDPVTILDWKSSRSSHDYTLQITRYAVAVNDLCPMHDKFVCGIVAPRLPEEDQLRIGMGPEDLDATRREVREIEERVDRMSVDPTIVGHPSDACQFCRFSGQCRFQSSYVDGARPLLEGGGALQLAGANMDAATPGSSAEKSAKATASAVDTFRKLTAPGSVFEGVRLTLQPANPAERGLRRLVLKTMADIFDAVKKDDARWIAEHPGTIALPGYKIQVQRGKPSVPPENETEMRAAFVAKYALDDAELLDCSTLSTTRLEQLLVETRGIGKTAAKAEVAKIKEPFTVRGADVVKWVANEKSKELEMSKADKEFA